MTILPLVIYNRYSVILEKSQSSMKRAIKIVRKPNAAPRRGFRIFSHVLCGLTFIACASTTPETTAGGTFEMYRQALLDGKPDEASRLMTLEAMARVTKEELGVPSNAIEIAVPRYGAMFTTASGILTLERNDGTWRVASSLPTYTGRTTPTEALQTFERSVRLGDWDTVFELIPPARRSGLTPIIIQERLMNVGYRQRVEKMLRTLLSAKQESITDTRGVMKHGPHRIEFIRLAIPGHAPSWFVDDAR